ncbi:MAG: S8 family serine peptidase [Casimicrobiaceae bacterium]|nr:S8 family serine peptidase [Casimicrobiaceae bacterium]
MARISDSAAQAAAERAATWLGGRLARAFFCALLVAWISKGQALAPVEQRKRSAEPAQLALGVIVAYEDAKKAAARGGISLQALPPAERALRLSEALGGRVRLEHARTGALGRDVLRFPAPIERAEAEAYARELAQTPGVRAAWPDRLLITQALPLDPQFATQWGFGYTPGVSEGANFVAAWDVTRGSASQTVGVIDGGLALGHRDFVGQLRQFAGAPLGGYDFISSATIAGDGDGRDVDPSETATTCGHGTHVAGTIGARTSFSSTTPAEDGAGGAPETKLLIARALNFTGAESDAIDAMLWLAGDPVPGLPANPHPVRAINMSFGGSGACGAFGPAIERLRELGVVAVAAAGNGGADVASSAPANCPGVIAVAASNPAGSRAGFSNFGALVTITAPGEDIVSTSGPSGGTCAKSGTSMAAPHVTAAVALLHAVNPTLSVAQTVLALRAGARPFPWGSNCTTATCGAGLLDARGAVDAVSPGATPRVGAQVKTLTVRENDGSATLRLSRIGSASSPVSVLVTALPDSAQPALDYGMPTSPVQWAAGDSSDKTVTVPILYRPGEQGERTFSLALSSPNAAVVAPSVIPVRIQEVDCATVTPIAIGQSATGHLGQPGHTYCRGGVRGPEFDTVRYQFSGSAGQIVSLELASTTPASQGVLDPYLYLLDSNKNVLAENDDIVPGIERDSRIRRYTLPTTGTYFIDVTTWSATQDARGTYRLELYGCGRYAPGAHCNLDVDGDQAFDAVDAQLVLRRLLGVAADALREGLSAPDACTTRTGSALATLIDDQRAPSSALGGLAPLDLDGDGAVRATTDGLLLLRVALGRTGNPATTGALGPTAARSTWSAIRDYLNAQCGLALP